MGAEFEGAGEMFWGEFNAGDGVVVADAEGGETEV